MLLHCVLVIICKQSKSQRPYRPKMPTCVIVNSNKRDNEDDFMREIAEEAKQLKLENKKAKANLLSKELINVRCVLHNIMQYDKKVFFFDININQVCCRHQKIQKCDIAFTFVEKEDR